MHNIWHQAFIFFFHFTFEFTFYALEFNRDVIDLYGDFDKPVDLEDFGDDLDLGDDVEDGFFLLLLFFV